MIFLKKNQETYNSRSRERYGDEPLTQPDFNLDLWMEVGSSGGPDKNRVYGLSNITTEKLWSANSVSTVGSSPSVSSTQSEEFLALKQQYERLSTDYAQFHQMIMEIRSKMGDDPCAASFLAAQSQQQPASSSSSSSPSSAAILISLILKKKH